MAKEKLKAGSVIDGYRVHELLHTGGMAFLWKVSRESDGATFLMKTPVLYDGEDPAAIVGFEMEQMIMPRLSGPHVPRFEGSGDFTNQPYIVMEKLEGQSLLPRLKTLPLSAEEVAGLGAKIADAAESLHRQRVIHLDIKPSNVMFRAGGEAVLIDYGLSRHLDLPDLMAEEFRLPYGSAPYMAPEQVLGIRHDPKSDLFAIGALMYFLATGERPFGDPQRLKGLKKRIWWDPVPPRAMKADIPEWLQEIILRCLEVRSSLRHASAAQLAHDLRNPSQTQLTARAKRVSRSGFFATLKRKSELPESLIDRAPERTAGLADAPIVAVSIDTETAPAELQMSMRETAARILKRSPQTRVACLNVLKMSRMVIDSSIDERGDNKHINRIVALKDWARPLELPDGHVTFHVLEAVDVANAVLEYARANNVDHIVMGARANSMTRKVLGSVSGKVAAEAPCTVTVVRNRDPAG
ncbi:MAG: protein kinase domain-containing protein [Aestuariivirga sp.]